MSSYLEIVDIQLKRLLSCHCTKDWTTSISLGLFHWQCVTVCSNGWPKYQVQFSLWSPQRLRVSTEMFEVPAFGWVPHFSTGSVLDLLLVPRTDGRHRWSLWRWTVSARPCWWSCKHYKCHPPCQLLDSSGGLAIMCWPKYYYMLTLMAYVQNECICNVLQKQEHKMFLLCGCLIWDVSQTTVPNILCQKSLRLIVIMQTQTQNWELRQQSHE